MKERLLLALAAALLVAAAVAAPGVAPVAGDAGRSNVAYADGEATPTPTPRGSNCQGGPVCGG